MPHNHPPPPPPRARALGFAGENSPKLIRREGAGLHAVFTNTEAREVGKNKNRLELGSETSDYSTGDEGGSTKGARDQRVEGEPESLRVEGEGSQRVGSNKGKGRRSHKGRNVSFVQKDEGMGNWLSWEPGGLVELKRGHVPHGSRRLFSNSKRPAKRR